MKRILDTVHGYIMVDNHFIENIIDTKYFQRLRRIEQTSIRSVYPSARHDRFIHSLGVYHIGSLIVEHLKREAEQHNYWGTTKAVTEIIYESYLAACLLHDVGHAPFSHSFEHYFGQKKNLSAELKGIINNDNFKSDLDEIIDKDEPNFHEYMSAIITCEKFNQNLDLMSIDPEFVARMITGTFYIKDKKKHQLHNCFISLLHGNIIDADRLDYACRDVWASGYSTSSIDLRRLISALHIQLNSQKEYVVCFDSNSLNEIEGVLNVKDFQVKYVLNHHTINYEQNLLERAALYMAKKYYPHIEGDKDGTLALRNIICKKSIVDTVEMPGNVGKITNLSDDDLIYLLKQNDNPYYEEWSSRKYSFFPLWKSRDEFYNYFRNCSKTVEISKDVYKSTILNALSPKVAAGNIDLDLQLDDILINTAKFKHRVKMNSLYLVVNKEVVRYTDIYPVVEDSKMSVLFYYVYIKKREGESREDQEFRKKQIIKVLEPVINRLYSKENHPQI